MLIALTVMLVVSCGNVGSIVEVMRGNLAYSRGDYQGALVHYMVAAEEEPADGWTKFNIGSVYYALGERDAALEIWHEARVSAETADGPGSSELALIFASSYNRGVVFYQRGDYTAAYEEFRYALSMNSRSPEAKANLELAFAKLEAATGSAEGRENEAGTGSAAGVSTTPGEGESESPDEQTLRILEYVRRKESQQWFANREIESDEQPEDW